MSESGADELERTRGEVDALSLQSAIVDAINVYCREVLHQPVATDAHSVKYLLARRVALSVLRAEPYPDWGRLLSRPSATASDSHSGSASCTDDQLLGGAFELTRPRSAEHWRALLAALTGELSRVIRRDVTITAFHAETDDPLHACWAASASIRTDLAPIPHVEATGDILVTVNVGESVAICAELTLRVEGLPVHGDRADVFCLQFTREHGWARAGWHPDETDGWRNEGG